MLDFEIKPKLGMGRQSWTPPEPSHKSKDLTSKKCFATKVEKSSHVAQGLRSELDVDVESRLDGWLNSTSSIPCQAFDDLDDLQ
jgi:hypothetical protein